jgi:uncharacterized protein YkwD
MTDRTPDRPSGQRRRPAGVPTHLRRRRTPGTPFAAVLALVLGVSAAMWWAGRDAPPSFAIGAAASLRPASLDGGPPSTLPRADRGEPRAAPYRTGSTDRQAPAGSTSARSSASPAPAPARTLMPLPATTTPTRRSPTAAPVTGPPASVADEVLRLTNLERAKVGCGPLHADARLAAAAQGHSTDMAVRDYFSHTTPEGLTPWDRARAAGYDSPSAENIAMGYRSAADVMAAWMQSAGHRQNILNCASHALGVGFDARGYYWTQMFGYV